MKKQTRLPSQIALAAILLAASGSHGQAKQPLSYLVIGNSVTLHGKKPSINWTGNWGMAATTIQNDYFHQMQTLIKEECPQATFDRVNRAEWERFPAREMYSSNDQQQRSYDKNRLIVFLGDNVKDEDEAAFIKLLEDLARNENAIRLTIGTWHDRPSLNAALESFAARKKSSFVKISDLSADNTNLATYAADPGVASHPSDKGMKLIAQRISKAVIKDCK